MPQSRPNILLFMMDTQGTRNMACYGYPRPTTPRIGEIATQGVLFENHFVTAPWTLPVHASLFTGRYESGHGAGAQHEGLEPGLIGMGDVLADNGYRCVALCNNQWAASQDQWNAAVGFEVVRYGELDPVPPFIPSDREDEKDKGSMKAIGIVLDWIRKHNDDGPWCLYVNCTEPHDAYLPPEPFRSQFLLPGMDYEDAVARKGNQVDSTTGVAALTSLEWEMQRALYDGSTACLDHRIGLLFDELGKMGVLDDTMFVVFGDHGDDIGEHMDEGYSYHSQNGVWDTVCHTPLVVRLPGMFEGGKRIEHLVQISDIFPGLLDLLEIDAPEARQSIQGVSLMGALDGPIREFALLEAQTPKHVLRRILSQHADLDPRWAFKAHKAARTLEHKYIWTSIGQDMLFDIRRDPDERWDLLRGRNGALEDGRYPEDVARELKQKIEDLLMSAELRTFPDMFRPGRAHSDPQVIRRLAAWGLYQPGIVPPWEDA